MRKILFLINSLRIGGAEKIFVNQANALKDRGFDVYFGVLEEKRGELSYFDKLKIDKDKYVCFSFKNLSDLAAYQRVVKMVRENKIDIIYSTLPAANFIAKILKIFKPKVKIVTREANVISVKSFKLRIGDIILAPLTDKVIAVSETVKKSLSRYLLFARKKIQLINNSTELPEPVKQEEIDKIKRQYHLENKFVILNVGALNVRQKGQIYALKSLNQLVKKHNLKDIKLLLAGDVRVKPEWHKFLRKNNLQDYIVFLGYLPPEQIAKFYDLSHLFILPSLWEGFPNVVLEAMAHKCPVIATDVGGIREVIIDEYNGLIIKPKDVDSLSKSIIKIKNNPQLAEQFAENGFKTIKEKFLFEKNITKLINLLNF